MKDSRFIELLNLYVDQQLTAAEATELETQIKQDPARRRTYQQYCRMQKGCVQLFEQECQGAPSTSALSRALAQADRKVSAPTEHRAWWSHRAVYASGLAAMAACVAFVLVRQAPTAAPAGLPVAATPAPEVVAVAATEPVALPAVQTVAIPAPEQQPVEQRRLYTVFPVRKFVPVQVVSYKDEAGAQADQPDFNWMKTVELAPMRPVVADGFSSEPAANLQESTDVFINNRRPVQGLYEKAAFQFQK